jgi:hypothetical protein
MLKTNWLSIFCCILLLACGPQSQQTETQETTTTPVFYRSVEDLPVKPCDLLNQAVLIDLFSLTPSANLQPYPGEDTPFGCSLGFKDGDRAASLSIEIQEERYDQRKWREKAGPLLANGTEVSLTDKADLCVWLDDPQNQEATLVVMAGGMTIHFKINHHNTLDLLEYDTQLETLAKSWVSANL